MLLEEALWPTKSTPPLLVIEHDLSRSTIPLVRTLLHDALHPKDTSKMKTRFQNVVLVTFLHSPSVFVRDLDLGSGGLKIIDRTERGFGEMDEMKVINEFRAQWSETLIGFGTNYGSLLLVIDSLDAMVLDVGIRHALMFLQDAMEQLKHRHAPSRIIVSVSGTGINQKDDSPSIINHVLSTSFTPTITHLRLYPPILFTHLSRAFLLPPPPRTPTAKFYSVFAAFAQRERREAEKLWYADLNGREAGSGSEGRLETVMEVVVRPLGMRKSVERSLEGWIDGKGVCKLEDLQSLRECFAGSGLPTGSGSDTKNVTDSSALDLPFNLNLTEEQVASRAKVPLPYAHTGEGMAGAIYYDPDSADDLDEEDPDEDLDL